MSTPAGPEVKALRIKAHEVAAKIWGAWDSPRCKKQEMYDWLKYNTKAGHIGMMDKLELESTIQKLEETLKWKSIQ